ncbi:hypothetical protein FN846DRAFT_953306 [Sphaerosporella brunnea]|uniref:Uncharacterized protein n=1 Tax=Sphaerosporella brunnea TaxID=1250544 RepID=A0A5J5EVL3_9PEZI|nr:hypothetical protein FN846DRAFT_953306 [Sphaerosporella brunnea]
MLSPIASSSMSSLLLLKSLGILRISINSSAVKSAYATSTPPPTKAGVNGSLPLGQLVGSPYRFASSAVAQV